MVDEHPEMIKSQMEDTRTHLAEKVEALGQQLTASVASATSVVADTVETVKQVVDTTTETVQASVEAVTNPLDFRGHFDKNPWLALGGAVAAGFVLGKLLSPKSSPPAAVAAAAVPAPTPAPAPVREESKAQQPQRQQEGQQQGSMLSFLDKPLELIQGVAMGSLFSLARGLVASHVPADWQEKALGLVEDMGKQLGADILGLGEHKSFAREENKEEKKPGTTRGRKGAATSKRNGSSRPEAIVSDR